MMKFHHRLIAFLIVCTASLASAQSRWTLTTADFISQPADLQSIDDTGVTTAQGKFPYDRFLQITRESAPKTAPARFILHTAAGDHLLGAPVKVESEQLRWNIASLGEISVPLTQIISMTRSARTAPATAKVTEDIVSLANGDQVKGIISDLSADHVLVQASGSPVTVPLDSVELVSFASTSDVAKPTGRAFRLKLAEGSSLLATGVALAGDQLTLTLADKSTRTAEAGKVVSIEQLNGPVAWLSGMDPAENVHTPYLDRPRPAQMDRTVTGEPIRFSDKTFSRGIGVYPYSRLTWKLDGTYAGFRTRYAIAGQGAYANVTVRIKLDEQIVHEQANVTAAALSPVIAFPLSSAKTLTLEVSFGQNLSVQDKFNWIEPALTKSAPAPTTQP
ncbi:MAG TPA: NPCBM/NEW2 domain-containing protein [Tepidisphaeraceae bacterium]|jgi:hypothetical protein